MWKLENNALYYCTKAFKHPRYGFGIYEGQCDKAGNASGLGRWYVTEPSQANFKGIVIDGCFKNNAPEGLSHVVTWSDDKRVRAESYCEFISGIKQGKSTQVQNYGAKIVNLIIKDGNTQDAR